MDTRGPGEVAGFVTFDVACQGSPGPRSTSKLRYAERETHTVTIRSWLSDYPLDASVAISRSAPGAYSTAW